MLKVARLETIAILLVDIEEMLMKFAISCIEKPNSTPVVFHNLSGYDSHSFVKNLGFSEGDIDCIPNNEERYISFTKNTVWEI